MASLNMKMQVSKIISAFPIGRVYLFVVVGFEWFLQLFYLVYDADSNNNNTSVYLSQLSLDLLILLAIVTLCLDLSRHGVG